MGVYRRPDSSVWWYSFMHNGKRIQGATGATDKKVAVLVYHRERNDYIQGKATGKLAPLKLRDLLTHYIEDYSTVNKASHAADSFRVLWEQVLEDLLVGGFGAVEMEATGEPAQPFRLWAVDGATIQIDGGWNGLQVEEKFGGQGLPSLIGLSVFDMLQARHAPNDA